MFGIRDGVGIFLPLPKLALKLPLLLLFHQSCRNRNSGSNCVSRKAFSFAPWMLELLAGRGHLTAAGTGQLVIRTTWFINLFVSANIARVSN